MHRREVLTGGAAILAAGLAGCSTDSGSGNDGAGGSKTATTYDDGSVSRPDYAVERVAEGLRSPWGITHLPGGGELLVTEQAGRLLVVDAETGDRTELSGVPEVFARGQGGLLDVARHPGFPEPNWVYLTYSKGRSDGSSTTALARGRLDRAGGRLRAVEELLAATPYVESSGHFGSRVVFGPDGLLYVSVGDRQFKNFGPDHVAQDRSNELGAILRLRPDGSVPDSNPFVGTAGARDTVFTYGNRNPQGLTVHPETGAVWASEFGEQEGDEINVLHAGANYGWPIADEGCTYGTGQPIGVSHADRDDVTAPAYTWECGTAGFPPSGTTFYDGDAFPAWQNDLFVGGLASQYIARLRVDGETAEPVERLLADHGWRIRALSVGPADGALYAAIDADPAPLVRLVPA
jgi:quinoprotein glucose dehydrogenase